MPPETCDAKRGDVNIAYQVVGDRGERELKGRAAGACTRSSRSDRTESPRPGTGHLMLGALLALAAGVVLAFSVANPPRGLVRLASRRGPPDLVWRGSMARSQVAVATTLRETPTTRLLLSARAMPPRAAFALHRIRRDHPQLGWYAAGGLLAAAVGVLVPYSLH